MTFARVRFWTIACAVGFTALLVTSVFKAAEPASGTETSARKVLQRMSAFYGNLKGFSVDVRYELSGPIGEDAANSARDKRHVAVSLPNRVSVKPLGDGEGEFVCDGKQLVATMPSLNRYLQRAAGEDVDALLADEASFAMVSGRVAVQLAGEAPLGDLSLAEGPEYTVLEPRAVDGHLCDRLELELEPATIVVWVQQGPQPLLRKLEWTLHSSSGAEADDQDGAEPLLLTAHLENWAVDGDFPEDTFAVVVPDDLEQVDSFTDADIQVDGDVYTQADIHPLLGKPAPACELKLLDGKSVKLQDHVGQQTVVLDFWASWCPPCIESLPALAKVAAAFADRNVACYAVNLGDDEETVRELLEKQSLDLPVVIDAEESLGELFVASSIPLTVIIDAQGTVQVAESGVSSNHEQELTRMIEAVMAGEPLAEQKLAAADRLRDPASPIPQSPDATTERDLAADKLAYNRHTLIDAYKAHGSLDPAWDDQALELLEAVARHFSKAEGYKSRKEIIAIAEPLHADGCDDPMVKYCYAAFLQDSDDSDEAQEKAFQMLQDSYAGLVERDYPANRRYAAAKRIWRRLRRTAPKSDEVAKFNELRVKEAIASIQLDDVANDEGRHVKALVYEVFDDLSTDKKGEFYEQAQEFEDEQPFLVNMIGGDWHLDAAWKARGCGWASDVTEEGWKGFSEHIAAARDCYVKAWEAAPRRPEAATQMITIAMAGGESPVSEMRLWFDRAVEAQFDYKPAYRNVLFGLLPRWHGSFGMIYQFGLQCKATERYDTDVPYMFCEALWKIGSDSQNSLGMRSFAKPGLYEEVHELCQRYIERSNSPSYAAWWKSVDLGFAYCAENWEAAAEILDDLDEAVDVDALGRFPLVRDNVIADVRLHTSPQAEMLLEILSRDADENRDQTIQQLTELADDKDLHPLVLLKIKSRLQVLRWLTEFESGEPVSLNCDREFVGWKIDAGQWSVKDDGAVRGVSSDSGVILICCPDFGPKWELSGEWKYGKSPYNPWRAGVFIYCDGDRAQAVMYNPTKHWIAAGPNDELDNHEQPFQGDGKVVPFKIRLNDGVIDVWIGDELVIEQKELPEWSGQEPIQFAIGADYHWSGSELTYRDLKIKKID